MQSVATPVDSLQQTRASLPERAAIGLVLALVLNALVRAITGALVDVSGVDPLGWGPILTVTIVAAVGATAVYVAVSRFSTRPDRHFTIVAAVVLVLSMGPVFTVAPTIPGVTATMLVALAVLHVTTAVGLVTGLTGVIHR
ncbi:hypothetical protein SAMN04487950_1790 [Halogranum rubrum]|uniref:Uncharacterized protein n=1 Tax=Halogranum rubrum TaxID=553466 RepID=A0A1I4DZV0_9EURY|nr:DUF6069 family protein [Halogranum rubrum]SFK99104.1 hypothetical protein SAMN04487950_1790 [Halogranum rubrum]